MKQLGQLLESDGRYEFRMDAMNLIVRGDHPEWVMQAASEVLEKTEQLEAESKVEELSTLLEFEAVSEIEVESAKFSMKQRFTTIPQCIVTMGRLDYKWAAPEGRKLMEDEFDGHPMRRIHDMSLTVDNSFLSNEPGVAPTDGSDPASD